MQLIRHHLVASRLFTPHNYGGIIGVIKGSWCFQMPPKRPLTDKECKNAAPKAKPYKLAAGNGLYLEIMPNGSRYWRWKYRILNIEKRLAIGVYPGVSLAEARQAADDARKMLREGQDPSQHKKEAKQKAKLNAANSFEALAKEWYDNNRARWTSDKHAANILNRLEKDIFPVFGTRPVADIKATELLSAIRDVERRGAGDVARRLFQYIHQIFAYAIATGRADRNPASDVKGALKPMKRGHFAALEPKEIPDFLDRLEKNEARLYDQTRKAIQILMLTFVRTSELIEAKWSEFDLDDRKEWHIPAARMKMRQPHIVPLSRQVISLLKELREKQTRNSENWVFPNQVRPAKPMSNATILGALKNMGYAGKMTGHGFRALAMTTIKEHLDYPHEVIDRQLAHARKDKVVAAYDRAQFLTQRTRMMQDWADYLDKAARKK